MHAYEVTKDAAWCHKCLDDELLRYLQSMPKPGLPSIVVETVIDKNYPGFDQFSPKSVRGWHDDLRQRFSNDPEFASSLARSIAQKLGISEPQAFYTKVTAYRSYNGPKEMEKRVNLEWDEWIIAPEGTLTFRHFVTIPPKLFKAERVVCTKEIPLQKSGTVLDTLTTFYNKNGRAALSYEGAEVV